MPWSSSGYLVVLSGATIETEAAYALGVNRYPPYSDSDFSSFYELGRYELNDTEQEAAEVTEDSMVAYLHKNDIDYYHYMVPCPEKEPVFETGIFPVSPDLSLNGSLEWIDTHAAEGGTYLVTVSGDETVAPRTLSYGGKTVSITLLGDSAERTVSLDSYDYGALFTVGSGVTLKLGSNVTLRGQSANTSALVRVDSGGTLVMNSGSKISGNTNTFSYGYGYGGGVSVYGGTFTMVGGEISGNTASSGGGVYVYGGTFTKQSGGIIYGADASGTLKNTAANGFGYGHAVSVSGDRRDLTVSTGESLDSTKVGAAGGWTESKLNLPLTESLAWLSANAAQGGAYTVTVSGDETVAPSTLSYSGKTVSITLLGGSAERTVSLGSSGTLFTVGNGVTLKLGNNITLRGRSSNTSALVRVDSDGALVMQSGSKISGNTNTSSDGYGGGVYVNGGAFTMSGGEISGNSASIAGGGVYAAYGTFTKQSGGVIYGADASSTLKNTATNGYPSGHAVYVSGNRMRNLTAGTGESLDSTKVGAAGGWADSIPDNLLLDGGLAWLGTNAIEGGVYAFILNGDETVTSRTLSYDGKTVSITLLGDTAERTVSLGSTGLLFTVGSGVTLTLGNNITLRGQSYNTSALIHVDSGGALVMQSGSKISGNTNTSSSYGGGGGGVYVSNGTFTMSGGEISGNSASASSGGGGVYVSNGTFTMSGGEISGNSASASSYYGGGGGVYVSNGTFTMSGGEISGNSASASSYGGGGGVYVSNGTFTMSGGEISGNSASASSYYGDGYGGGVYVSSTGMFAKQLGGIIYGGDASSSLKNTARSNGDAVYVGSSPTKVRNSTAGVGVTLDSRKTSSAGGWE
jgi:hypothetical protein